MQSKRNQNFLSFPASDDLYTYVHLRRTEKSHRKSNTTIVSDKTYLDFYPKQNRDKSSLK